MNLLPIVGLLAAWILAVSLVLAAVQVRFRDIGVALPVLVQILMFASPIIYPLSVVPRGLARLVPAESDGRHRLVVPRHPAAPERRPIPTRSASRCS